MGAGQIGGIATLLDIDFQNAAGFTGVPADVNEAQYIVHFFSHAMLFCVGALIEPHVIVTIASCVYGEKVKFEVYGGTHSFTNNAGVSRQVIDYCAPIGYNHTMKKPSCTADNIALLVIDNQFSLREREGSSQFVINRIRYALPDSKMPSYYNKRGICRYYGWGSRRNGFLLPLLLDLYRVDVTLMPPESCDPIFNCGNKYLCIRQPLCRNEKYGAMCPDDPGTVLECDGYLRGIMGSWLVDRPCGIGFLDMHLFSRFITCGVDDSRDMMDKTRGSVSLHTNVTREKSK